MPVLVRLQYCVISMYANDHNPPHFHVLGLDGRDAIVRLGSLTVLNGDVDRRALKEALEWASQNPAYLEDMWNEFQDN
jgi:Domain of unknown function (DUF4160)